MAIKCLYHSDDLDGMMSKYIVERNLPECISIGYTYSDEFPHDQIGKGDTVFVVDLSPSLNDMQKLAEKSFVIWIDHHISSIENYDKMKDDYKFFNTLLEVGESACYLTYKYFNPNKPVPLGIKLLSYADTGQWDKDRKTKSFDYGVRTLVMNDETVLRDIYDGVVDIKSIVQRGIIALEFLNYYSKISLEPLCSSIEFEGYDCLLLNVSGISTHAMKFWNANVHPIFIRYFRKDGVWVIMLASEGDVDVGAIAVKHNGGGHKNASGFTCKVLPFKI